MSSYLTSIRRHVPSLKSTLTKTGVQEVNENENTSNFLTTASTTLSNPPVALTEGDPWCDLTQDEQEALLKRILQFNNFDVERANKQLHSTLHWRSSSAISSKHVDLMYGLPAGIPISVVATHHDHVLTVAIAEKYLKSMVDHSHQQLAVSRMLEYFVYDRDGPRTSKVTVVVDFTNFAFRHVDITGLKNGISIYMNHYPEVIHKVFLVNYPKFLYGGMFICILLYSFINRSSFSLILGSFADDQMTNLFFLYFSILLP